MTDNERALAKFTIDLERFARGQTDEFLLPSGTRFRRLRTEDGELLERLSADGGRVVVPFSAEQRDLLLGTAKAGNAAELDALWRERAGFSPADIMGEGV